MEILLNEDLKTEIRKQVKAKEVFSENAMNCMLDSIRDDEDQRLADDWDFGGGAYSHIANIDVGNMYLSRDVLEYVLYAYELSFHDFMEEFHKYVLSTEQLDCAKLFEKSLADMVLKIDVMTDEPTPEHMATLWDDMMDRVKEAVDKSFDLDTFIEEGTSYSYMGIAKSNYHDAFIRLYPDMKMEVSEQQLSIINHITQVNLIKVLEDMGFSQ